MENTPGEPSTGAMGTVSTHLVKDPQRCTYTGPKPQVFAETSQVTVAVEWLSISLSCALRIVNK